MALTESLKAQAERELHETRCACGAAKERGKSFCWGCYVPLRFDLKRGLTRSLNDGYAEAYDEAKDFLRIETDRLNQKPLFGGA